MCVCVCTIYIKNSSSSRTPECSFILVHCLRPSMGNHCFEFHNYKIVLLLPTFHLPEILQYPFFYLCDFFCSVQFLRFIHVVYSCVCINEQYFIVEYPLKCSPVNRYLDCLQVGAIKNKAAMNICMQIYLWISCIYLFCINSQAWNCCIIGQMTFVDTERQVLD